MLGFKMRTLKIGAAVCALLLAGALPASAHVTVSAPGGATKGGYDKLVFKVPTEKNVPTVKLDVAMPTATPLAYVLIEAVPGWSYQVIKGAPAVPTKDYDGNALTQVVTRIVWTATDGGIKPGEFGEFAINAGPMPNTDKVTFRALQTYADKSVVSWIETAAPGAKEPEHPAPTLTLVDAPSTATAMASGSAAAPTSGAAVSGAANSGGMTVSGSAMPTTTDHTGAVLGGIGLGVGVIALLGVAYLGVRTRKVAG